MRALLNDRWESGLLDYHRAPDEYRVQVEAWRVLEPLRDLYFQRARSLRTVLAYLGDVGPRATVHKILSRTRESRRNDKYVSCGIGRVIEAPESAPAYAMGARVVFVAPCHPAAVERLALPEVLLATADEITIPERDGWLLHREVDADLPPGLWREVAGWNPHSGARLGDLARAAVRQARELVSSGGWSGATWLRCEPRESVCERSPARIRRRAGRASAVLFGYGNYAKTTVLPGVRRSLQVVRVHELDPAQVPLRRRRGVSWDTAPWPRENDTFDACLLAGYHHTHGPLAVAALERGATAVVEKPVVTTREQLDALLATMEATGRPLYACFQRRYMPFNEAALHDLGATTTDPISYHCIVYEVPLPPLHWYRWPSSRSRLVSNGCHWVDHFLHLNGYAEVRDCEVRRGADGSLNVSMALANGAAFTMTLTDRGSPRLGVEDHVELRTERATAVIVNNSRYRAQRASGGVRRRRISKTTAYRRMYREITRDIAQGGAGNSTRSVAVSAGAMLLLEAKLEALASSS